MGTLWTAGQRETASMMNQYYGFADTNQTTVTAAVQTTFTTSYSIPANEASVGSAYEVSFGGSGTWGSTQQLIGFTLVVGGVIVINNVSLGAQAFAASASFRHAGRALIVWNAIGVSGTCYADMMVNLSQTANAVQFPATVNQANLQAASSWGLADANGAASSAIDTTSAVPVIVKTGWASTTGAPTITNRHTVFKKVA